MKKFYVINCPLCWLQVARQSQTTYVIIMNGSDIEIDVHRLNDGGLLLCYDGNSHTTYMKEEVDRQDFHCETHNTCLSIWLHVCSFPILFHRCSYRVTVGNKTCVFEKERDPTVLRSPSAGKLLQFTVEDGDHIFAGEPYAEIEVWLILGGKEKCPGCVCVYCPFTFYSSFEYALFSGDEDGDDSDRAAVWLYTLCQEARGGSGARLCHGAYGAGRPQQYTQGTLTVTLWNEDCFFVFFSYFVIFTLIFKAVFFFIYFGPWYRWSSTQPLCHPSSRCLWLGKSFIRCSTMCSKIWSEWWTGIASKSLTSAQKCVFTTLLSNIPEKYKHMNFSWAFSCPFVQLKEWVATLMKTLRDPSLPLLELQEIMTSVASRIPPTVEKDIRKVMAQYASNITSVLCQFPSQRVKSFSDHMLTLNCIFLIIINCLISDS